MTGLDGKILCSTVCLQHLGPGLRQKLLRENLIGADRQGPVFGFKSSGATIAENKETVKLELKTSLMEMQNPIDLRVIGRATVEDREIARAAVPAEDRMQAFLWRHLLPAETLPALVYDPAVKPRIDRVRPAIPDKDIPKDVKRTLQLSQVDWYLRQIETLYQEWLLTDAFANREIAKIEAQLVR